MYTHFTVCVHLYRVCIFVVCTFAQHASIGTVCAYLHSCVYFRSVYVCIVCAYLYSAYTFCTVCVHLYVECTWTSNLVSHRNDGVWHGQGCSSPAHEKLVNERQWNAGGFHRIGHFAVSETTILNVGVPFNYYRVRTNFCEFRESTGGCENKNAKTCTHTAQVCCCRPPFAKIVRCGAFAKYTSRKNLNAYGILYVFEVGKISQSTPCEVCLQCSRVGCTLVTSLCVRPNMHPTS